MKKRTLGISLVLSAFALTLGAFLIPSKSASKAYSISYSSSLPTTIKFKDNTDQEIQQYYASLNNLAPTQRSGTNLLKNLRDIIHDDITYYPYGSIGSAGVTQIYTITDRDWTNSPISSISSGTYDSVNNKITGYDHAAEKDNNPYITMLYVDYTRNGPTRFLNGTAASFDKEHVWSQSHGFKADSGATGPAGTDLHHLIAGEKAVNQQYHSNYTYGNVAVAEKAAADGEASTISPKFIISGNKMGTAVHTSSHDEENKVFEPCDADKGRIARALLYMVACYNNYSGNESISDFDPNLELVDYVVQSGSSVGSSASTPAKYGILSDILAWHKAYPPTQFEIHRNNLIYNNYQFNRNPFIDYPEWADFIWGNADSNYQSTGYATPSTDTINGYNDDSTVSVTGVSLNTNSASIAVGQTQTLTATISPSNATNTAVTWSTSNGQVATVSNGTITAVSAGNAIITVTTSDGGFTATCNVTVTSSGGGDSSDVTYQKITSLSALESGDYVIAADLSGSYKGMTYTFNNGKYSGSDISVSNNSISATDGNARKFSLNVSGTGNSRTVTIQDPNANSFVAYSSSTNLSQESSSYNWSVTSGTKGSFRFTSETSGRGLIFRASTYNVFGGYSTNNVTTQGNEYLDVELFKKVENQPSSKTLESITLDTSNVRKTFFVGDSFNYEGLSVTANYSDETDAVVTPTSVTTPDLSTSGQKTVTVSYTESGVTETANYTITVNPVELISISISGYTTEFEVGDSFSFGGTVTANYNNQTTSDVTSSATFSGYDMSISGNQTVTVSYGGFEQHYQITLTEDTTPTNTTQYRLIQSTSDLEFGKSYIITNGISDSVKAMSSESNTYSRKITNATVTLGKIVRGSSILSFTLGGYPGAYTFETDNYAGTDGYLCSGTDGGTYNNLLVSSTKYSGTISFNDAAAVINLQPHSSRTLLCFSSQLNSNNGGFACYANQLQNGEVYLWKQVDLTSIALDTSNVQTSFSKGEAFNYDGLKLSAYYSSGPSNYVTPTNVSSPDMTTTGDKTVTVTYTEGSITRTASYTINVNTNPSISWNAPTINVYSGSTLSGTDVNNWNVTYNDGDGHITVLTYSQMTVKLGGETISIPHTWSTLDDGKVLTATYNSLTTSASSAVQITQRVNSIMKHSEESTAISNLTFSSACGGSGTADDGKQWTVESDGNESSFDNTKGIHYGTGSSEVQYILLSSSGFSSGQITKVEVNASTANGVTGATLVVRVGGNSFGGTAKTLTNSATNYTFNGNANADTIEVEITKPQRATNALYCLSVKVTYTVPESTIDIANSLDHIEAQRVAVKYAKAFNTTMSSTDGCTTNMSTAWSACSAAYDTFLSEAAELGTTEEAYAKDLIKFATAQYTDDSGEACIERMMKTYEVCVQKHEQTPFMSDLVTVSDKAPNQGGLINVNNATSITVVVILSVIMITALGGYLFIRRYKQK